MDVVYAVNWGHDIVQTRAVGEGHVWVYGQTTVSVCVDICGF